MGGLEGKVSAMCFSSSERRDCRSVVVVGEMVGV